MFFSAKVAKTCKKTNISWLDSISRLSYLPAKTSTGYLWGMKQYFSAASYICMSTYYQICRCLGEEYTESWERHAPIYIYIYIYISIATNVTTGSSTEVDPRYDHLWDHHPDRLRSLYFMPPEPEDVPIPWSLPPHGGNLGVPQLVHSWNHLGSLYIMPPAPEDIPIIRSLLPHGGNRGFPRAWSYWCASSLSQRNGQCFSIVIYTHLIASLVGYSGFMY